MDFRAEAAEKTLRRIQDSSGAALANFDESGCVPIPGGRIVHCAIEIPLVVVSLLCLIATLTSIALTSINIGTPSLRMGLLLGSLAINLTARMVKSWIVRGYLKLRADSVLRAVKDLPDANVGIENGKTHQKLKLVIDDEGICLMDAARQRLLIEGFAYRYVLYARDVYSLEPVSGFGSSGVLVKSRMAGADMDFAFKVRGHGPIASLVQTFSPATGAKELAVKLARALFDSDTPTFHQAALPPPLPS
jgi:hypothetical protein